MVGRSRRDRRYASPESNMTNQNRDDNGAVEVGQSDILRQPLVGTRGADVAVTA